MATGKTDTATNSKGWATSFILEMDGVTDSVCEAETLTAERLGEPEPPAYTALDRSRKYLTEALETISWKKPLDRSYLNSKTNPLFAGDIDLRSVGGMFRSMLAASPTTGLPLLISYHFFIGATTLLPDALIPSLNVQSTPRSYESQAAEWNPAAYGFYVYISDGVRTLTQAARALRHEFSHLMQEVRGAQLGWNMSVGILADPIKLAQMRVSLPALNAEDPSYAGTVDFYEAITEHYLLRTIFKDKHTAMLANLGDSRLKAMAEALKLPVIYSNTELLAETIYDQINDHMVPIKDALWEVLTHNEGALIAHIREIDLLLYQQDPAESEAYGLDSGGFKHKNPFVVVEANGSRGVLQLPGNEAERLTMYGLMTEAAEKRRNRYLAGDYPFFVDSLLGGNITPTPYGHGVLNNYTRWLDPRYVERPTTKELNRLSDKVCRTADMIFDRAERIGRSRTFK